MSPARDRSDRCPGVLRLHEAADGFLARVRLPGGFLRPDALRVLADAALELGDGRLELTSRANLQVRGMTGSTAAEFTDRIFAAGLVPSIAHDEVRNIVASPLAGLETPVPLRDTVRALDEAICADADLTALNGRFLFGIDDGHGDIAAMRPDVLALVRNGRIWVEGQRVAMENIPAAMIRAAHRFLDERTAQGSTAWRVTDLDGGRERLRARLGAPASGPRIRRPVKPAIGGVDTFDFYEAVVFAPALGRLNLAQSHWLADHAGGDELRITPARRVVITRTPSEWPPPRMFLIANPDSPYLRVSACAGKPRCASALADVQHDAEMKVMHGRHGWRFEGRRVHLSGCERRCGRTPDVEVDLIATPVGYRFETPEGQWMEKPSK